MPSDSTTVFRVLCSGGARGLADMGVIQGLTEKGCTFRPTSGFSIGARVGGIYCTRKLELYADWVLALERAHVLRLLASERQAATGPTLAAVF